MTPPTGTQAGNNDAVANSHRPAVNRRRCALATVVWWSLVAPLCARDFWLEVDPGNDSAVKSEERALHLRAGDSFPTGEEQPLQKEGIVRFDLYADQSGKRDLLATGKEGQTPAAKLPPESGACLVVMDRKERQTVLDAEKFNRYLADEGQDAASVQRTRPGQTQAEVREVHTRYLKALVPGTNSLSTLPNTFYKRRVGQRLEILLQNNPGRLTANRRLVVKVLFEGRPLPGVRVSALRRESVPSPLSVSPAVPAQPLPPNFLARQPVVTSAQGLAEFKLDGNGEWLVRLVYVRAPAEHKGTANAPWESFWASYSFVAKDAPGTITSPVLKAPAAGQDPSGERKD